MSALDLAPQLSDDSALVASGLRVSDAGEHDSYDSSLVEHEARTVRLGQPLELVLRRQFSGATLELVLAQARALLESQADEWGGPAALEEGIAWDPERHPRWPPGTPGGLGGQFMRAGQRFSLNGVEYDVARVFPGGVIAHVATHGTKAAPKTVEFSAKELAADFKSEELKAAGLKPGQKVHVLEHVTRPPAEPIHGAKQGTDSSSFSGTVIDPYVDPSTHDPSLPIPEGGDLKPEEWKRFGRADQIVYSQLMERFGPWKADGAQKLVDSLKAKADSTSKALLHSAYQSQFGSSSGFTLSLHSIFSSLKSAVKGSPDVEAARKKFEDARYWQSEAADGLRWDLYNRVRSPDITLFHGTSEPGLFANDIIKGGKPVFSGLSQSQRFSPGAFGSSRVISPIAIRNIVLATTSAEMYASSGGYKGEQEVSVMDAFRADSRSMVVPDSGSGSGFGGSAHTHPGPSGLQSKWLSGVTQHGIGGWAVQVFKDSYKDAGASLPVPPDPPVIQMDKAGGKQWVAPPVDATQFAYVDGKKTSVLELSYAMVDAKGHPKSMQVKQMVEQGLLKPGDYIEGMQGTRYLIVEDKADKYLGLAYYKISDLGSAVEGTATKNADTGQATSAFAGHQLYSHGGTDVFGFEGGGSKAFKLLKGHYELPTLAETKGVAFNKQAWVEDSPKKSVFTKDLQVGDKFKVGNGYYEVIAPGALSSGQVKIRNLEDNEPGQINGTYKTPKLLLKAGYTEAGVAVLDPADFFKGAQTTVGQAFDTVTPGDVMLAGHTVYTVMSKTQEGGLSVADQTGKLKTLDASAKFQPLTPKPLNWSEPEIGDVLAIDGEKATLTKVLKDGTLQFRKAKGGVVKLQQDDPRLLGIFHANDYNIGPKTKLKELAAGTLVHGGSGEKIKPYMVVKQDGKQTVLRNLETGDESSVSSGKSYSVLVAKQVAPTAPTPVEDHALPSSPADTFNVAAFEAGPAKPASSVVAGDKFSFGGSYFEVIHPINEHGGGGLVKNLETGHDVVFNGGDYPVTTLVPKTAAPASQMAMADMEQGQQFFPGDTAGFGGSPYAIKNFTKLDATGNWLAVKKSAATHVHAVSEDGDNVYFPLDSSAAKKPLPLAPEQLAPVPATKFDPSAYVEKPIGTGVGANATGYLAAALKPGTIVKGKSGGYYRIDSVKFAGDEEPVSDFDKVTQASHVNATNLVTGKHTKFKPGQGFVAVLEPKASGAVAEYDDLKPSDPVDVLSLHPGDQFTNPDTGTLFEVVGEGNPDADEPNIAVAVVQADGSLGPKAAMKQQVVKFYAHAADKMPVQQPGGMASVALPSVADLPSAESGGFVPFKWHKGGHGTVYTKLQEMTIGTVFIDKSGNGWKLAGNPGANPIIMDVDGKLYAADGALRGRHVKYGEGFDALIDKLGGITPEKSVQTPQETAAATMKQKLVANDGDKTLGQLGLGIGDVVEMPILGGPLKITSVVPSEDGMTLYSLYDPASGKTVSALENYVPKSYKPVPADLGLFGEEIKEPGPSVPEPKPPTVGVPAPEYPNAMQNVAGWDLSTLKDGIEVTLPSHPGAVFLLQQQPGKFAGLKVVDTGGIATLKKGGEIAALKTEVPTTFGPVGSHEVTAAAPSDAGFSGDVADYDVAGSVLLHELAPGDFFKTAKGKIFQLVSSDDNLNVVKDADGDVHPNVVGSLAVVKLTPKADVSAPEPTDAADDVPPLSLFAPMVPLADLQPGQLFSYGSVVGKVVEVTLPENPNAYGAQTKVKYVVLKGDNVGGEKVQKFWKQAQVKLLVPGMPLWLPGEYAKVVKPGTKSGKTVKLGQILPQPDGSHKYLVRYADGKGLTVPESWLQPLKSNPQWKTVQALGTNEVQVDEVPQGSIVKQPGAYGSYLKVGETNEAGHVKMHNLASGGTGLWANTTKVEVVLSPEQAVAAEAKTAQATQAGSALVNVSAPSGGLKLPANTAGVKLASAKAGDKFELDDGSVWQVADVPLYGPATGVLVESGSHYGPGEGWKVGHKKEFVQATIPAGFDAVGGSGVYEGMVVNKNATPFSGLDLAKGDKFAFDGQVYTLDSIGVKKLTPATAANKLQLVYALDDNGKTVAFQPDAIPSHYYYNPHPPLHSLDLPSGFVNNEGASAATFLGLGLGPGDKIVNYKGEPETVQSIEGEPGTNGHVYNTVNDVTGGKGTYGTGGKPSAYKKQSPTAESPFAEIPPLTINYPNGKGLAELGLEPGDYFVDNGTPYKLIEKTSATWWTAQNLETGKDETFGPGFPPTSWAKAPESGAPAQLDSTKLAAGLAATINQPVTVNTLSPGDHFTLDGELYVAANKNSVGTVKGLSLTDGTEKHFNGFSEVLPVPAAAVQRPINALSVGEKFTTGQVAGVDAGQVWQKIDASSVPQGLQDQAGEDPVWAKGGDLNDFEWFGSGLPVTPLPSSAKPAIKESVPIGSPVTPTMLQPGDFYQAGGPTGNTYVVASKKEQSDGSYVLTTKLMKAGSYTTNTAIGSEQTFSVGADSTLGLRVENPYSTGIDVDHFGESGTKAILDLVTPGTLVQKQPSGDGSTPAIWRVIDTGPQGVYAEIASEMKGPNALPVGHKGYINDDGKWLYADAADIKPEGDVKTSGPLEPFKWQKGGTGQKNVRLHTLKPGDKFEGKSKGEVFTVVSVGPGAFVKYADAAGAEYVADAMAYVRLA